MVSILLLTLDRLEHTKKYVPQALETAGTPYELLVCDNGSSDPGVNEFIKTLNPKLHIRNHENKGVYTGLNSLLQWATGDYFVKIDNDIELPNNWLKLFTDTYKRIPNAGMAGIHTVELLPDPQVVNGVTIHPSGKTYGTMFWSKKVFDKVGFFNEKFNPYGLGDSEYMVRIEKSGFMNFYLHNVSAVHRGFDGGSPTPYRKMKSASCSKNIPIYDAAFREYDRLNNYYLPINNV
jgi:glycosyltransferase involved in cell wall biosynthesis